MKTQGFTLIELVVVIVILGILAATAVPKFVNLQAEAKTATLEAVKASMDGAAALVHGKSLVKGNHNSPEGDSPTVDIGNGVTLSIHYGYPKTSITDWRDSLLDIDTTAFDFTKTIDGSLVVFLKGATTPVSTLQPCLAFYKAAGASSKPEIGVNPCS